MTRTIVDGNNIDQLGKNFRIGTFMGLRFHPLTSFNLLFKTPAQATISEYKMPPISACHAGLDPASSVVAF
jgi:hypothetical protein